jgi:A/G-specific adenine glycosylase
MSNSAWPLKTLFPKSKRRVVLNLDDTGVDDTGFGDTGFDDTGFDDTGFDDTGFDYVGFDYAGMGDRLLIWYGQAGRDLPWRRSRDPYAIWISEIMLQQTQVKTVMPYFERWLGVFSTIEQLAAADQQQVLKAWEGLGYYSRARNLHRTAQIVAQKFGGVFPQDLETVLKLPGIGRTTAGGILSAAFNLPLPILDGNVKRVIARLMALEVPPVEVLDRLWGISERLVPSDRGRDFNQAFMDLGATLCTPKNPDCGRCPWQGDCQAYQQGLQTQIPKAVVRSPVPHRRISVLMAVNKKGEVLIIQRPQEGLLGGLWDFPQVEGDGEALRSALLRPRTVLTSLMTVKHAYTHFKVTFEVYQAQGEPKVADGRWVKPEDLQNYPFPKSHLKMIRFFLIRNSEGAF